MYQTPTNLFQQKLKTALTKESDISIVKDLITLHMYKNSEKDESQLILVEVYNLLGLEKFTQLIELINGRPIKFPKKSDFRDTILQSLSYYYHTVENKTWDEVKEILGPDLKTIRMGIKNSQFQTFLNYIIDSLMN
jgi:hypothetical protein